MADNITLTTDQTSRLFNFHTAHFPGQPVPNLQPTTVEQVGSVYPGQEDEDDLGYYEDGVKRTLTNEEIQILRHGEIQRLLQQRRQAQQHHEKRSARKHSAQDTQTRMRRFEDEEVQRSQDVATLTYDEDEVEEKQENDADSVHPPKTFLWPRLGD